MDVRRDRRELIEAVKRGLEELYPELEIVDEDLELEREGRRADLAGVDGEGRLALVFIGVTEGDEPLLELVDALSFAQKNHALLFGHFQDHRLQPERGPLALFVSRSMPARLLSRVEGLGTDRVRLLELRALSSARGGDRVYIVPVYPPSSRLAPLPTREVETFLRQLPAEVRARAHGLLRRVFRIDDQLEFEARDDQLVWCIEEQLLCSVLFAGRELEGHVPPHDRSTTLRTDAELEDFLGQVLVRYVSLLRQTDPSAIVRRASGPALRPMGESLPPSGSASNPVRPGGTYGSASPAPELRSPGYTGSSGSSGSSGYPASSGSSGFPGSAGPSAHSAAPSPEAPGDRPAAPRAALGFARGATSVHSSSTPASVSELPAATGGARSVAEIVRNPRSAGSPLSSPLSSPFGPRSGRGAAPAADLGPGLTDEELKAFRQ